MFGVVCAGRPMQTPTQIEPTKYVFSIENAAKIHHMVVFLLPNAMLDPTMAASVYFQLPGKEFQLLGAVTMEKPSSIFKINNTAMKQTTPAYFDLDAMVDDDAMVADEAEFTINVGISLEPLANVQNALEQQRVQHEQTKALTITPANTTAAAPQSADSIAVLANKIVQHAYNFLSGFTGADGKVPMRVFDDWWAKFKSRLASDPKFLDTL